ncbi:MAG TPA: ornithine cyclodeaminase family protein [Gemmatimonadaceae bacterium]|nr:ornithine cyclodeaminase family protein [Gemmatimonadaceae bacterium]
MLVLGQRHAKEALNVEECIEAVEAAFHTRGFALLARSAVAGVALEDGKLHAKLATLDRARRYAVAKVNANVPGNPAMRGLPAIQGILLLFDASTGIPLAAMDSGYLTALRTAAATAVAAKWLALPKSSSVAVVGCGVQARAHVAALLKVRPLKRLHAFDADRAAADSFCADMESAYGIECRVEPSAREAVRAAQIVVTLTPSRTPIISAADVGLGTFVAAVGADSENKHEIGVDLLRSAVIVVDDLDQCATIGDLHHAIQAGALKLADVRASLDQIVTGHLRGRVDDKEVIVFDSTGVAIEDAAAAAIVYEKAELNGMGVRVDMGGLPRPAQLNALSSS